jgi:hypothetical protein
MRLNAESTAMIAAKEARKQEYAEALRSQMAARASCKGGKGTEGSRARSLRRPLASNAVSVGLSLFSLTPLHCASLSLSLSLSLSHTYAVSRLRLSQVPPSPAASSVLDGEGEWERYMLGEQRRLLSDVYL